ncbi:MAG: hypothetical protein HYX72_01890 [Acidobacteria bacterium]|nr:hypothetical protein [Acidobacteriota bacterium]
MVSVREISTLLLAIFLAMPCLLLAQTSSNIYWSDWTTATAGATNGSASGAITLSGSQTIGVTYSGDVYFAQTNSGTNYWNPNVYTSSTVSNSPSPNTDIIAFGNGTSPNTITFSQPVTNPVFAFVSLNGPSITFNAPFTVLSSGCGYWGCGNLVFGTGNVLSSNGEGHGTIMFPGTFTSISFQQNGGEYWRGFTVGIAGSAVQSDICSASNPAPISGSTGAQGVLDPANTDPSKGLVWPAGSVAASISMDTGLVTFSIGSPAGSSTAQLPGVSSGPVFADGKLNFISVHLPPAISVTFVGTSSSVKPVIILSCQDAVLDAGSVLSASGLAFPGANVPSDITTAGFGPRSGSLPAPGSLYPAVGGSGGDAFLAAGGGYGSQAMVIAAAQRITVNGRIAVPGAPGFLAGVQPSEQVSLGQGGAGGSVRLAALLVEGSGTIDSSAGNDSDGIKRSPDGPVELQAFLQDLFGGTTTITPIRGNGPVQPIPSNLPLINIDQVDQQFGFTNTGSLTTPDVTLAVPSIGEVDVELSISTELVPEGTRLAVRAVGVDGSSFATNTIVSEGTAVAGLTLNAGTTYQITAVPTIEFSSLRNAEMAIANGAAGQLELATFTPKYRAATQWMKAFGLSPQQAANTTRSSEQSRN